MMKCEIVILRGSHHGGHGRFCIYQHLSLKSVYQHAIVQLLSWRQGSCPACIEYLIALVLLPVFGVLISSV